MTTDANDVDMTPKGNLCSEIPCAEYRDRLECRVQRLEAQLRDLKAETKKVLDQSFHKLEAEEAKVGALRKRIEKLGTDKETLREVCETVYYQITNHGNMGDLELSALVSKAMNVVVERRSDECTCGWTPHLMDCPADPRNKRSGERACPCKGDNHDPDCESYCSDHGTLKPCRHCLGNRGL